MTMPAFKRLLAPALLFCLTPLTGHAAIKAASATLDHEAPVSQFIVKLRAQDTVVRIAPPAMDSTRLLRLSRQAGTSFTLRRNMDNGTSVLRIGTPVSASEAEAIASSLSGDPEVEQASPDYRRHALAAAVPNDPSYSSQWALFAPTASITGTTTLGGANLLPAWNISIGNGSTVIAVIDTGIRPHPDISARILQGYDFISNTFVANDGDGRDSDASDPGDWVTSADVAANSSICSADSVDNSSWHGTHVAGIAAATGNNSSDIAGVNWRAGILPVRVLGKCGGTDSDIIDAIRWSAGLSVSGVPANAHPAQVINMSLGGGGTCTSALQSAIDDAYNAGVTIVAATGNDGARSIDSPANCNHVIAVMAHTVEATAASYSNTGARVLISAPGGGPGLSPSGSVTGSGLGVLSLGNTGTTVPAADRLVAYMGTSMATPHVAGTAALIHDVLPSASPLRIRQIIANSARAFPAGSWCTQPTQVGQCGKGLLDTGAALTAATTVVAGNHAPVANALPTQTGPAKRALSFQVSGSDSDGDDIAFDAVAGLPAGAQLSDSGGFFWLSPVAGIYTVSFIASDGLSESAPQTVRIEVFESKADISGLAPTSPTNTNSSSGGSFPPLLLLALGALGLRSRRR